MTTKTDIITLIENTIDYHDTSSQWGKALRHIVDRIEKEIPDNPTPHHLHVNVRNWRDKTYGNTYNSFQIIFNGLLLDTKGMDYGYDNGEARIEKWLHDNHAEHHLPYFDKVTMSVR